MKFDNAAQMIEYAIKSMDSIERDPSIDGRMRMFRMIAEASGLSRSTIEKFYHGRMRNLTISSIDNLHNGLRKVKVNIAKS